METQDSAAQAGSTTTNVSKGVQVRPKMESKGVCVREKNDITRPIKISKEKLLAIKNNYAYKPNPDMQPAD